MRVTRERRQRQDKPSSCSSEGAVMSQLTRKFQNFSLQIYSIDDVEGAPPAERALGGGGGGCVPSCDATLLCLIVSIYCTSVLVEQCADSPSE